MVNMFLFFCFRKSEVMSDTLEDGYVVGSHPYGDMSYLSGLDGFFGPSYKYDAIMPIETSNAMCSKPKRNVGGHFCGFLYGLNLEVYGIQRIIDCVWIFDYKKRHLPKDLHTMSVWYQNITARALHHKHKVGIIDCILDDGTETLSVIYAGVNTQGFECKRAYHLCRINSYIIPQAESYIILWAYQTMLLQHTGIILYVENIDPGCIMPLYWIDSLHNQDDCECCASKTDAPGFVCCPYLCSKFLKKTISAKKDMNIYHRVCFQCPICYRPLKAYTSGEISIKLDRWSLPSAHNHELRLSNG